MLSSLARKVMVAGGFLLVFAAFAGSAMAQPTETVNNFFEGSPDRGGNDPGGFEPSMPDDAGYIDDSSFDDSSGGGFDDA